MNAQLASGVLYTGTLPVLVETLSEPPQDYDILRSNESNETLLKSIHALDDKPELDETDPVSLELRRQDQKMNLLLDMLSTLLRQNQLLPPLKEVELTTETIRVHSREHLPDMQACRISLYVESHIPKPLTLFAISHPSMQAGVLSLSFTGLSQNVKDALDKFIFRQHRKRVAQTRKA